MIRLVSMNIFPNVDIPEQVRRRMETRLTATTAISLGSLFAEHGNNALGTAEYAMSMSDICRFSTSPDGFEKPIVNISDDVNKIANYSPNSRIYNFTAELVCRDCVDMSLIETSYIVSGYTSEAEPTLSGLLPDDMLMYINDIHGIQTTYRRLATGGYEVASQRNIDNYVLANVLSSYGNVLGATEYLVNPASIASTGTMISSLDLGDNESLSNTEFTPTLGNNVSGAQLYDASIVRPEALMGSIVKAYVNHEMNTSADDDDITSRIFNTPHSSINQFVQGERLVCMFSGHEFVRALSAGLRSGTMGGEAKSVRAETTARFALGDFMAAISNSHDLVEQIANSLSFAQRGLAALDTEDNTDSWVGMNGYSTRGSIVAYDIGMRLGAIMSSNLIGKVSFGYDTTHASSFDRPRIHIIPESIGKLSRSNISMYFAQRLTQMLETMLYQATEYGRLPVVIGVQAVLGVVTRIEVRVDGDAPEFFTFASFMSSRLHIGQSNDRDYINGLGQDASKLYNAVQDGFSEFNRTSNLMNITDYMPVNTGANIGNGDIGGSGILDDFMDTTAPTNTNPFTLSME